MVSYDDFKSFKKRFQWIFSETNIVLRKLKVSGLTYFLNCEKSKHKQKAAKVK